MAKATKRLLAALLCLAAGCSGGATPVDGGGDGGHGADGGDAGSGTPPVLTWVAPSAGAMLSGTVMLSATATDDVGVASLEFRLDSAAGALLATGTASGSTYSASWGSAAAANGPHTLYAVARDAAGSTGTATLAVTVSNTTGTTGGLRAVPTFEVLGLYLPAGGGAITAANVRYRVAGTTTWSDALPLWYDARDDELRGSILGLSAGLAYEVEARDAGGTTLGSGTFGTWSEDFPVDAAHIITIDGTRTTGLDVTESGTPTAYRLVTAGASGGTIDMGFAPDASPDNCITVSASYVIVRGLTLRNCQASAVEIEPGAHDVIVEGNDMSGFGAGPGDAVEGVTGEVHVGYNETAAVSCTAYSSADADKPSRIIVQGNRIHDPRYGSNPWSYGHPAGTNAIGFFECGGNHVIRFNDVIGSQGHYFMDGIGGSDNFTATGFPNHDSDVYGNYVAQAYDDGIEAEGGNMQVRVWGNFITSTYVGIANGTVTRGPIYVLRNVTGNHGGLYDPSDTNPDGEERGILFKLGSSDAAFVGGKAYYFHNTTLQPACPAGVGATRTCGVDSGMQNSAGSVQATNIEDANNVFVSFASGHTVIGNGIDDASGTFSNDVYVGNVDVTETGGIAGSPVFTANVDEALVAHTYTGGGSMVALRSYDPTRTPNELGDFSLAAGSPGRGAAKRLPNINEQYASPDCGAHQSGTPNMVFGTAAWHGAHAW